MAVNHPPRERSRAKAEAVVREIAEAEGQAFPLEADISREEEVAAMVKSTVRRSGGLDLLVNNAGIERASAIADMTLADWQAVIDVNLTGQFLCSRAATKRFLEQEPDPSSRSRGTIIFISSVHEIIPWAFQANYAASKGGVALLMRSLAQELAPNKIRVNSIAPGAIRTPINRKAWSTDQSLSQLLKLIPYGRIGEVEDVAKAVVWLASDEADYVTGATLVIDGGMTLYPAFRGAG